MHHFQGQYIKHFPWKGIAPLYVVSHSLGKQTPLTTSYPSFGRLSPSTQLSYLLATTLSSIVMCMYVCLFVCLLASMVRSSSGCVAIGNAFPVLYIYAIFSYKVPHTASHVFLGCYSITDWTTAFTPKNCLAVKIGKYTSCVGHCALGSKSAMYDCLVCGCI